jgi:hypothetical protein
MLIDHYRRTLLKRAERDTRRKIKKTPPGTSIEMVIWGLEHQNAYLAAGWKPIFEAPRTDSRDSWSEMTLRLDIHPSA